MASVVKDLKAKFANDDFNPSFAHVIYQYAYNPQLEPASLDKLKVYGYGVVVQSNMGVVNSELCNNFAANYSEHILVLINEETNKSFALLLPAIKGCTYMSYLFRSGDCCFPVLKDSNLVKGACLIRNMSGDEHLINIYDIDDNNEYMLDDLIPKYYVEFSKFCIDLRKKKKILPYKKVLEMWNKK